MNANKINVQKHVANICFSIHNAHRAQHILVRMMKLPYSINFTFIHVFCFVLRGYIAPPGGFMAYRCTGLMVVHLLA